MKTRLLLLAALAVSSAASARMLSPEEAMSRAQAGSAAQHSSGVSLASLDKTLVYTEKDTAGEPSLYVFTNSGDRGFVVLSASDLIVPVLGYSDSGSFDADNMPPSMKWWMEQYAEQIRYAEEHPEAAEAAWAATAAPDRESIAPMCATLWNQDKPYNNLAPSLNGEKCPIGCVATAMAQVMKYHEWPAQGRGSLSYKWDKGNVTYNTDFSRFTFDWDNMLDRYAGTDYTEAEANAVADLMYACAMSVSMDFAPKGSGAVTAFMAGALVDYFDYDKALNYYTRDYYDTKTWNNMAYDNLVKVGPVVYCGQGKDGGHCFVCDGYSKDNYFHINWGWGGSSDGYFLLSALDPSSLGIGGGSGGFNRSQGMILGIQKPAGNTEAEPLIGIYGSFSPTVDAMTVNVPKPFNSGGFATSFVPGLKLVSPDGKVYYYDDGKSYSLNPMHYLTNGYNTNIPASLPDGTYTMYPVYYITSQASEGTGKWREMLTSSNPKFKNFTKKGNVITISEPEVKLLSIKNLTVDGSIYYGLPFTLSFTASNENIYPVSQEILPLFTMFRGMVAARGTSTTIDLEAGESRDYTLTFNFQDGDPISGSYNLVIGYESEDNSVTTFSSSLPVNVLEAPEENAGYGYIEFDTPGAVDPENVSFTYTVICEQGVLGGLLKIVFANTDRNVISTQPITDIKIESGTTLTDVASVTFPTGVPGTSYLAALFLDDQQISNAVPFTLGEPGGIDGIESDEEGVKEYYDLRGMRVSPDNLAPGMYIVRTVTSSGVKTSKIIVK